jgi:hypothetical protein
MSFFSSGSVLPAISVLLAPQRTDAAVASPSPCPALTRGAHARDGYLLVHKLRHAQTMAHYPVTLALAD